MQNPFSKAIALTTGDPGDLSVVNVYSDFYDEFLTTRPEPGSRLILKINADGEFAVWVNGRFVTTGQHSQFPGKPCVEYADITDFVVSGTNRIAVCTYRQGLTTSTYIQGKGQLLFEVIEFVSGLMEGFVVLASSEKTLWRFSPCYKSGPVPQVSGQLGFTFAYTKAEGDDGFLGADYSFEKAVSDGFTQAVPLEDFEPGDFTERNIEKLAILDAKSCELVAQGLFDFGKEYRETNSKPHAYYMQNAALKSKYIGEIVTERRSTREIPAPDNYALEPKGDLLPAENAVTLKTSELVLTGALREGRGVYAVADIGEETLGYLSFRFAVKRPTVIGIAYSDHLDDLRARSYVGGRCFSETIIIPAGETAHTHILSKIGARYLMIYAETDEITVSGLGIVPVRYPVDPGKCGNFKVNDALHTKIYSTCLSTLLLCMNEHYMDCPQREQALYAMDSRNQMLTGYYTFGEYDYARESLSLLARSQRPDGLLCLCAPAKVSVTIPSFSLHWVIALCEYTKYSGDIDFFNEHLRTANAIMASIVAHRTENGALVRLTDSQCWNFHEWTGELSGTIGSESPADADACLTALFIIATESLADILLETGGSDSGKQDLARKLSKLAASMRLAFNETFFDEKNGLYCSYKDLAAGTGPRFYSQFANALAILSGAAALDPACLGGAVKALTGEIDSLEVSDCTLSTCLFKYDALMSLSQDYIGAVMNEITELWGYMIGRGATSFWETIKGGTDFDDAGSLCHGWSAIPAVVYYKYILGIKPVKCGFREYSVKPAMWDNHFAKGKVFLPARSSTLYVTVEGNSFFYEEKI